MTDLFTFVHLTDLHIGNPDIVDDHLFSDTTANLKALLADIKTLVPQPKFIVATGDLTNQGDAGSYRNLKAILDAMGDALVKGHRIEIRGFGSFSVNRRSPRIGRNPRSGESVMIPEKRVPHFKPGKALREQVDERTALMQQHEDKQRTG